MATKVKYPTVKMKCEDCIHLNCTKAVSKKKLCSLMGVKPYNLACEAFTPHVTKLAISDIKNFKALNYLTSNLDSSSQRLLAMSLLMTASIRERGYSLGERVYYDWYDNDSLDSYVSAIIIGTSGEFNELVILAGDLGNDKTVSLTVEWGSIISATAFNKLKERLVKEGKLFSHYTKRKTANSRTVDKVREKGEIYVRTIDDVVYGDDDKKPANNRKSKENSKRIETVDVSSFTNNQTIEF